MGGRAAERLPGVDSGYLARPVGGVLAPPGIVLYREF
ncbi:hypothetical protein KNU66_gp73 [Gordonia phage McKinley]|uniref:Uncharacterized protein n=1 Tax=Gordonia phage McKinley TaxID=2588507 RepID=A0A4Y6ELA5_9CAUD|nr:hypothetical protein KNU66_gp73 [Gordonia phage McKinley]QDF19510.1 hypothetical protein SEA_MCKINLEY_73 [Gordonia phage McKinley]